MRGLLKMWRPLVLLASLVICAHAGTVLTTDGVLHEGELAIDHGIILRASLTTVKLPLSGILRARFATADGAFQPGLVLVNGARIAGAFSSLNNTAVKVESKRIAVPGNAIAWAIYNPISPALAAQIPRGKTGTLLPGGDFFEGTPRGGDASSVKVLSEIFGPRTFSASEIHALILREIQPQPSVFEVLTRDGSSYPALDVSFGEGAEIVLRHPLYNGLRVPAGDLVEIRAGGVRLDEIKPTTVTAAPGRDVAKCFMANGSFHGGGLKLGTREVGAGFECAAGATVWWTPSPGAGTFFAIVAANDDTPAGQKLTFSVYAGGKLAGRSAPLAAGDPPAVLRCAVPIAENLALRIESTGGAASNGTWGEPMLLRR
jgi:hypothetical protein